jgi:CheY-like chemotaxis protein
MVVDDEPDIYDVLVTMFQLWGIDGVAFVDGAEAVQWVDSVDAGTYSGELPELAILDIRLPGVDGHHVAARIRRSPKLGDIAIVLITAYRISPEQEKQIMLISQADLLLEKPLPAMSELRTQLDALIARRQALAAARRRAAGPVAASQTPGVSAAVAPGGSGPNATLPTREAAPESRLAAPASRSGTAES